MKTAHTEQDSLLPGRKPVLECLRNSPGRVDTIYVQQGAHGHELEEIVRLCKDAGLRFKTVPRRDLDRMAQGRHQGVAARLAATNFTGLDQILGSMADCPLPLVVALDQVQDPHNAGTLARTLYALGGAGMILPKDRTAFLGAGAAKASAGALTMLPVARVVNLSRALDQCADQGLTIYAGHAAPGALNIFTADLSTPAVLVLGNEDKGIRPGVAKRCDQSLMIPMARDFDSLNVAQAGAIIISRFAAPGP